MLKVKLEKYSWNNPCSNPKIYYINMDMEVFTRKIYNTYTHVSMLESHPAHRKFIIVGKPPYSMWVTVKWIGDDATCVFNKIKEIL